MDYYKQQITLFEEKVFQKESGISKKNSDAKNKNKEMIKAGYTRKMLDLLPN